MPYFQMSFYSDTGEEIFSTAIPPQEFVPLVRQVSRDLERYITGLENDLPGYQALVTPIFVGDEPAPTIVKASGLADREENAALQAILKDSTFFDFMSEQVAFNNPEASRLCQVCSDRPRCPAFNRDADSRFGSWIEIPASTPLSPKPIEGVRLQILSAQGEQLFRADFSLGFFQTLVDNLKREIQISRRFDQASWRARFYLREGDPPPVAPELQRLQQARVPPPPTQHRSPSLLVDWDTMTVEDQSLGEIDIEILEEEAPAGLSLCTKPLPQVKNVPLRNQIMSPPGSLKVYIYQTLIDLLEQQAASIRYSFAGFLVGSACQTPDTQHPFIEVEAAAIAPDKQGIPYYDLNYEMWRDTQKIISEQYPNKHTLGWFKVRYPVQTYVVLPDGHTRVLQSRQNQTLALSANDAFMHENFFIEKWQVCLMVDARHRQLQFYHWRGETIARCPHFVIV